MCCLLWTSSSRTNQNTSSFSSSSVLIASCNSKAEKSMTRLNSKQEKMKEPLLAHQQTSDQSSFPSSLITYLYSGHFLARWGARMWEFSVGLYMISIWPESLLLAAIYGVVESSSTALLGPIIGEWVDKLSYVKVLRLWLLTQNISFVVAGGTVVGLVSYPLLKSLNPTLFIFLVTITNISGAIGVLSTLAGTILIEREWVVVISEGQPPGLLTKMNSVIRRIDLICKLFAPVVSGFIISFISLRASAMALSLLNTASVWFQYWLLMSVYDGIPSLSQNSQRRISRALLRDEQQCSTQEGRSTEASRKWNLTEQFSKIPIVGSWRVYLQQEVLLPGVALALLYFTVLSFGTLMTATLEWEGTPAFLIGIARGVSATVGIAATLVYPVLQSQISTLRTGLWSIWSQWSLLLVCVASIWVRNSVLSAYMLMAGVATSRLGLWMFDLAVIQQMQDEVPECDRCVVGGVQNSLQSILELMAYVMGIFISNPQEFWKLMMASFLAVTLSAVLYTLHVYRVRRHLIHWEKLLCWLS